MSCNTRELAEGAQSPNIRLLPPREYSEAEMAMIRQARKNRAQYDENRMQLFADHPDRHVVIVKGGEVHAFGQRSEMYSFLSNLDKVTRLSAFRVPRWRGNIGHGYLRVVR